MYSVLKTNGASPHCLVHWVLLESPNPKCSLFQQSLRLLQTHLQELCLESIMWHCRPQNGKNHYSRIAITTENAEVSYWFSDFCDILFCPILHYVHDRKMLIENWVAYCCSCVGYDKAGHGGYITRGPENIQHTTINLAPRAWPGISTSNPVPANVYSTT